MVSPTCFHREKLAIFNTRVLGNEVQAMLSSIYFRWICKLMAIKQWRTEKAGRAH